MTNDNQEVMEEWLTDKINTQELLLLINDARIISNFCYVRKNEGEE